MIAYVVNTVCALLIAFQLPLAIFADDSEIEPDEVILDAASVLPE